MSYYQFLVIFLIIMFRYTHCNFLFQSNVISFFFKGKCYFNLFAIFSFNLSALASWFQWVLKCNIITAHHFHHIKWPFSFDLSGSILSTGIIHNGFGKMLNWTIIWTNLVVLHWVGQVINHHVDLDACPPQLPIRMILIWRKWFFTNMFKHRSKSYDSSWIMKHE